MKPRIKHGQQPGDVSKQEKIDMREHPSKNKRSKSFLRMLKARERAVLKEQIRKIVHEWSK